ncbi:hypothetical protein [Paraburkholderia sp.]|uniref:hypothetical protein n=1 Tax=Paraburkholderia sp. TaxID=1926495 RepID=UPI0025D5A300|nr:hypothetical protein [Paraburkholderia sp.]
MHTAQHGQMGLIPSRNQSVAQPASAWLLGYAAFHDALQREETDFGALPPYVKLPVLRRLAGCAFAPSSVWVALNEVRAAYIEVSTPSVAEVVRHYFSSEANNVDSSDETADVLETLAATFPPAVVPLVARPPCLLSPGKGIFLEGWQRFVTYWARNDGTIPLLAVDWPTLYDRLTDNRTTNGGTTTDTPH